MAALVGERILIDCDPGHDDAVALLMALAGRDLFDVVGVTTVAGNIDVAQAERNARAVCALAGRADVAVRAGCARPLVHPLRDASDFHGATGLDGLAPLPPVGAHPEHAVDFIVACLDTAREPLTLVCLAPLTNVAMALIKAPHIAVKIKEIVFMGGARSAGGNVTPCATFNLVCDPHAAHVVFESGCPLSIVSLDATAQVVVGRETLARIARSGGAVAQAAVRMLDFFNRRRIEVYGYGEDQTSLNDPCVIAYLLDRSLFAGRRANVAIEHRSDLTMGMTVVDFLGRTGRPANALWLDGVDAAGVLDMLVATLGRYPAG
jgi:purine nucleosidase